MNIKHHIFREYDIRGDVGTELTDEFAYLLGRSYATLARDKKLKKIAIGYDCRESSEGFANALARGLAAEGLDATITGMGPTPQLYWAVHNLGFEGGIQVTGSHNPPEMNGFKLVLGGETLSGAAIQDLKNRLLALPATPSATKGNVATRAVRSDYIADLVKLSKPHMGSRKLKVVVDAGNGVGGLVGPEVLRQLGVEVIELFCDPDGRFPNHHPDPTVLENLEALVHKVKETKADFGIGWDGDADRIGVVDEQGQPIYGDMLLLIYGREILKTVPNATIIGDVKCSTLLFKDINQRGGNAIMWKTGHSLIKGKLKETHGELAGEMSGHIMFKHRFYGFDDALYSSNRLVEIMSAHKGPISSLLADLPRMVSTPEIRVHCPENVKFKIPERAQKAFSEYEVNTIDGVRIQMEHGWALVRASNTQPVLVMRFEAENTKELDAYQALVKSRIDQIARELGQ